MTVPITWLASGAEAVTYCWTTAATRGSSGRSSQRHVGDAGSRGVAARSRTIDVRPRSAATSSPVLSSIVSVMSVRIRPNDEALVISRVTPFGW